LGYNHIQVIRQPRVAILTTGDELVGADQPLSPGKIHDTNSYTLAALVTTYGGQPIRLSPSPDTLEAVRKLFHDALAQKPDIIISSAGVSVGATDLIRIVLDELGEVNLWRINLRPGKPLAFGHLQGIPFFGLPGNPVSAMVTFDVIVRPALLKLAGKPDDTPITTAIVGEDIPSDGRRTYARVKLNYENGQLIARTTGTQSSGALMSMVVADGLLIIPEGMTEVAVGTPLPVRLLRPMQNR
jgi:molybdopterin molybdotransferase